MKKKIIVFVSVVVLAGIYAPAFADQGMTQTTAQAPAKATALFQVKQLVVCTGVENRAPVGAAETFSADTQKVFAFLDATKITEDTQVTFVWMFGQKQVSTFQAPLKKSVRWRTFASKTVSGMKGDWTLELKDADGNTVKSVQFKVE